LGSLEKLHSCYPESSKDGTFWFILLYPVLVVTCVELLEPLKRMSSGQLHQLLSFSCSTTNPLLKVDHWDSTPVLSGFSKLH
ncbi:hypothetical protein BAE44_0012567, partial [Dichanthelium oligosanthes]